MKSVNVAVNNAIRKNHVLYTQPKLTAEWNMNRYFDTEVDNIPSDDLEGYDIETFPIESIVLPFRPTKGILKARTDEALVTDLDKLNDSRFYAVSELDVYHYWTSPFRTDESKSFVNATYTTGSVKPFVLYNDGVYVNKIVIKIENFWASPDLFYIKTMNFAPTEDRTTGWTTVATSPTISSEGEITLYYNGTSWSSTKPTDLVDPPLSHLYGVQVDVRTMKEGRDRSGGVSLGTRINKNDAPWYVPGTGGEKALPTVVTPLDGKNAYFNLIEISARREVDLSNYLINCSDQFDAAEPSNLYPIGTITSNTGSVTLSNLYLDSGVYKSGLFNNDNEDSPYFGMCQPNVRFNLEYIYDISGTKYPVQQFVLYCEDWFNQTADEISLELTDASKFLKELTPPPALYEGLSGPKVFQRLLDSVGFVDWILDAEDLSAQNIIPIYWTTGENNVWEELDELAKATQSAIYFDEWGKLQISTQNSAYRKTGTVAWTARGEASGVELPDIISIDDNGEIGPNHYTISYQSTAWDEWNNGAPNLQKVWEPDDSVVLVSSPLIKNFNSGDNIFWINPSNAPYWPYSGHVQIDGEIVRFSAKHFVYYTGVDGGTFNQAWVANQDEYDAVIASVPAAFRSKNFFSGAILVYSYENGDLGRGEWNSEDIDHKVDISNYDVRKVYAGSGSFFITYNAAGLHHMPQYSVVQLRSDGSQHSGFDTTTATIGSASDTGWKYAGTKVRFDSYSGMNVQQGGLVINHQNGAGQNAYYIALNASGSYLGVWSMKSNVFTPLAIISTPVAQNVFYEIDVALYGGTGNQVLSVFVNGRILVAISIPSSAAYFNPKGGKFGMFISGNTIATFEYLYGIGRDEPNPSDDSSFFNLIYGGYTGQQWQREWVFGTKSLKKRKKKKSSKETARWNNYFFDEFGPYVHEIREFDVKFDPMPVRQSRLYMTNEWNAAATQYLSSPFGAKFTLVNTARQGAIMNGDDNTIYNDRTVNQVLTCIGRVLVIQDTETVEVENTDSIRARGRIESELESQWIQTKAMAQSIADWMNSHWGNGSESITMNLLGNPLFNIGDIVAVEYPLKHMNETTHKYFVTSIRTAFDNGITTELGLRRVV